MHLFPELEKKYTKEQLSAAQAQRLAQEIAFAPVVFQVSRLMIKFDIFEELSKEPQGLTFEEVAGRCNISVYAARVLLESSLTIGSVLLDGDRFTLAKTGWFLLNDPMVRVNMDFNHDVNYLGLFDLEDALVNGKPAGLSVFGDWETIYEGLSQLPEPVQKSWFGFDHFYSDHSFTEALDVIFRSKPRRILDVGGNTGRWATRCVDHDPDVEVTIMDLPQQLEMMRAQTAANPNASRISGRPCNILDEATAFPEGFDAIWMSQFLDCFSDDEIVSIVSRAARAMSPGTTLYVMETFWDRQKHDTAAYCLTQISLYFTALANGNSKMYHSDHMASCIERAGLQIAARHDGLGLGHTILECRKVPPGTRAEAGHA